MSKKLDELGKEVDFEYFENNYSPDATLSGRRSLSEICHLLSGWYKNSNYNLVFYNNENSEIGWTSSLFGENFSPRVKALLPKSSKVVIKIIDI
jgi:hypothetical protein